ncbi:MAG TPA: Ig-like domain-containing protein, partial [Bacteroidales bacterium]|nr:Ig-like domain-containing protein [Bacteroidales bacterium]
ANSATDVAINVTPTITFDEAVRKTDGNSLENADLASLITFKKTNSGGTDVPFTATIDATKKVITVTPSSTLDNSQVYYLAVGPVEDASGNESTTSSASFTTIAAAAPTVTLTYPAGGETFYAGSPTTFTWTSANITNVKIEVWSPDNSRTYTWNPITASTPAAAGTFAFTVPSDLYYGTQYKIRISDASNAAVYSESGNFTCIPVVASLTDLKLRSIANDIIKVSGEVILTFKRTATNRNQKYIQDSGAGMLIDDAAAVLTTILTVGDKIKDFEGKLGTFNGMCQMVTT